MTDDRVASALAGWRAIEQAADPGPWEVTGIGDEDIWSESKAGFVAETIGTENTLFVVTARTAFPLLLAAIEAVLKLADEYEHLETVAPSGEVDEAAALGIRWVAAKVRAAITAKLLDEEADHG